MTKDCRFTAEESGFLSFFEQRTIRISLLLHLPVRVSEAPACVAMM